MAMVKRLCRNKDTLLSLLTAARDSARRWPLFLAAVSGIAAERFESQRG